MDVVYLQTLGDRFLTLVFALTALLMATMITFLLLYLPVIYMRLKKREQISLEMLTLQNLPRLASTM